MRFLKAPPSGLKTLELGPCAVRLILDTRRADSCESQAAGFCSGRHHPPEFSGEIARQGADPRVETNVIEEPAWLQNRIIIALALRQVNSLLLNGIDHASNHEPCAHFEIGSEAGAGWLISWRGTVAHKLNCTRPQKPRDGRNTLANGATE
jgi:hypothetical protein